MILEQPTSIKIAGRSIGQAFPPLVIAEIGINHEGDIRKALQMVDDEIGRAHV